METPKKNVTIFRTYVSTDARIPREELQTRLAAAGFDASTAKIVSRRERDGLRFAVRDLFASARASFVNDKGEPSKLLVTEAKQSSCDVKLDVHARADGAEVHYSDILCSFELRGTDVVFSPISPNCWATLHKVGIKDIDPQSILSTGMNMMYDRDIRKTVSALIPQTNLSTWRGVYFSFGEAGEAVRRAREVFANLPEGQAVISALTLEYTPENMAQLAADMTESFRERFMSLLSQLKQVGPNLEAIRRDFDQLLTAHAEMEKQLGEDIDIYTLAHATEFVLKMKEEEENQA